MIYNFILNPLIYNFFYIIPELLNIIEPEIWFNLLIKTQINIVFPFKLILFNLNNNLDIFFYSFFNFLFLIILIIYIKNLFFFKNLIRLIFISALIFFSYGFYISALDLEFFGLLIILVYVGAILVLFSCIIFLDKKKNSFENIIKVSDFSIFFNLIFLCFIIYIILFY